MKVTVPGLDFSHHNDWFLDIKMTQKFHSFVFFFRSTDTGTF